MLAPNELIPLLAKLMDLRIPAILVGPPGHGKSTFAIDAAKQAGRKVLLAHPVVEEPPDVRIPWVVDGVGQFLPMGVMKELTNPKGPPTAVIIEDLGQATTAMQASYMQPMQARELAGFRVRDNVSFAVTTNRREDWAGAHGIISAIINRAVLLHVQLTADQWAPWALSHNIPPALVAFARFKSELFNELPPRDMQAWPTPRSLTTLGIMQREGIESTTAWAGVIGENAAIAYKGFLAVYEALPDVDKVLANPRAATLPKQDRPDVAYALMGALTNRVTEKTAEGFTTYISRLVEAGQPEYAIMAYRDVLMLKPALTGHKAMKDFALKHYDFIEGSFREAA